MKRMLEVSLLVKDDKVSALPDELLLVAPRGKMHDDYSDLGEATDGVLVIGASSLVELGEEIGIPLANVVELVEKSIRRARSLSDNRDSVWTHLNDELEWLKTVTKTLLKWDLGFTLDTNNGDIELTLGGSVLKINAGTLKWSVGEKDGKGVESK